MKAILEHGGYNKKNSQGLCFVNNNGILAYHDGNNVHEINSHYANPSLRDAEIGKLEQSFTSKIEQVDIDELLKNVQDAQPGEVDNLTQSYPWVAPRIGRMKIYQTRVFEGICEKDYKSDNNSNNKYIVINRVIVYFEDGKDDYQQYRGRPFNNGICFHVYAIIETKDHEIMNSSDVQASTMSELYTHPVYAYNKLTRQKIIELLGDKWKIAEKALSNNSSVSSSVTKTVSLPDFDNTISSIDEDPQVWPTKIRNGFCQYQGERETEYKTYKYKYVDKPTFDMLFVTDDGTYKFANNLIDEIWKEKLEKFKDGDAPEVNVLVDSFCFASTVCSVVCHNDGMNQSCFSNNESPSIQSTNVVEDSVTGNNYTEWKMDKKNSFIARIVTASNWLYNSKKYSFFQPITFSKNVESSNFMLKQTRWVYEQNDVNRQDIESVLTTDNICSYWWLRAKEQKSQKIFTMLYGYDCDVTKNYYEKCINEWNDCKQNNKDFWNGAITGTEYEEVEGESEQRFQLSSELPWVKEFVISRKSSSLVLSGILKEPDSCRCIVYDNLNNSVINELNTATATKYSELKDENALTSDSNNNIDVSFYYTDKTSFDNVTEVTLKFNLLTGVYCLKTRLLSSEKLD